METLNKLSDIATIPVVFVSLCYLAVIVPTYFFLKKVRPSFWWIVLLIGAEITLINVLFFLLIFNFVHDFFNLKLLYYGFFVSSAIFLVLPVLAKGYIAKNQSKKVWQQILLAYLFLIIVLSVPVIGFYYLISLSINAWFQYLN